MCGNLFSHWARNPFQSRNILNRNLLMHAYVDNSNLGNSIVSMLGFWTTWAETWKRPSSERLPCCGSMGSNGGRGHCARWHVLPLARRFFCRRPESSPHFYDTWPCLVWAGKKTHNTKGSWLDGACHLHARRQDCSMILEKINELFFFQFYTCKSTKLIIKTWNNFRFFFFFQKSKIREIRGQIIEETVWDVPQQVRERGCWQQSVGECDWPGDTAQHHPLATSQGPREAQLSICSQCSKKGNNEKKCNSSMNNGRI